GLHHLAPKHLVSFGRQSERLTLVLDLARQAERITDGRPDRATQQVDGAAGDLYARSDAESLTQEGAKPFRLLLRLADALLRPIQTREFVTDLDEDLECRFVSHASRDVLPGPLGPLIAALVRLCLGGCHQP